LCCARVRVHQYEKVGEKMFLICFSALHDAR
jgi:hypothetical protein